jgi:hypothetical protein
VGKEQSAAKRSGKAENRTLELEWPLIILRLLEEMSLRLPNCALFATCNLLVLYCVEAILARDASNLVTKFCAPPGSLTAAQTTCEVRLLN